jgi:hypothetical protein
MRIGRLCCEGRPAQVSLRRALEIEILKRDKSRALGPVAPRASCGAALLGVGLFCTLTATDAPAREEDIAAPGHKMRAAADLRRTVILSDSSDAYYELACEISRAEQIDLVHSREEITRSSPVFVIWVVSPGGLSEADIVAVGEEFRSGDTPSSWGIITGSTLDMARELYRRSPSGKTAYSLIDARRGVIVLHENGSEQTYPLESEGLSRIFRKTACLAFSGHGGGSYWRLSEEFLLTADDIPPLPPLVVTSGACGAFDLRNEKSIALGFTDRGAAAYAGFLYSPAPHYLFGHPYGFPLRNTWPGFPIGFVVSMQGRATLDSYAGFPFFCLLGDPRLAFRSSAPYRLVEDDMLGEVRRIRFAGTPRGCIPVRIEGGASYDFVEVLGLASAGEGDLFYNSKLQMMDLRDDKLLLLTHEGGGLEIRLHPRAPLLWRATDFVSDALDHAYVYMQQAGGGIFFIVVAVCVLFATLWFTFHIGLKPAGFRAALLIGVIFSASKGLYALFRAGRASIVSLPLAVEPHFYVGAFVLTGCGALLFFNVRKARWKTAAVLVATFPTWAVAAFWLAGIAYVNIFGASPRIGMNIYSYALGLVPAFAFAAECILVVPVFSVAARLTRRDAG